MYDKTNNENKFLFCLPVNIVARLFPFEIIYRLFRLHVHFFHILCDGSYVIIQKNNVWLYKKDTLSKLPSIIGNRPLVVSFVNDSLIYGSYFTHESHSDIGIYRLDLEGYEWVKLNQISNIRHIHGINYDCFSDSYWITTGDSDSESNIYVTFDNFKTLELAIGGSQIFRAVTLLFDHEHIYYGTDSPDDKNYICKLNKKTLCLVYKFPIPGPVFYGIKSNDGYYFSTVCEPSKSNATNFVSLFYSSDGSSWECIYNTKKDYFSMRYFQYGQLLFPNYLHHDSPVVFTSFSTTDHCTSYEVSHKI